MALSVLARLMRQGRFAEFETGDPGPRTSPRAPAARGHARGSLGSMGSTTLRHRNPQAQEQRERAELPNPILAALQRNR